MVRLAKYLDVDMINEDAPPRGSLRGTASLPSGGQLSATKRYLKATSIRMISDTPAVLTGGPQS